MLRQLGWYPTVKQSSIPSAGLGLFVEGKVYPGAVLVTINLFK